MQVDMKKYVWNFPEIYFLDTHSVISYVIIGRDFFAWNINIMKIKLNLEFSV
jgi:hypothetical protein